MRSCITVSSLFLVLLVACEQPQDTPDRVIEKDEYGSLLLPEHRDTTTVYRVAPDSVFDHLSYEMQEKWDGSSFTHISFEHLANVVIDESYFEESIGEYIKVVHFSDEIESLDGKRVMIKGYLLPISHTDDFYFLSANPYTQCFFCNQAGIESIMELKMNQSLPGSLKMDQIVMVTGILELSSANLYKLPYTLHDVRIMKYY